jgi:sugar O-acyltransferase (sialic acid O-acetyltransferase NeuD family)
VCKQIRMPRIGSNDDYVTLAQWTVKNGDPVKENQVVAILETTKETSELLCEADGFIEIKIFDGEDVKVDDIVAVINANRKVSDKYTTNSNIEKDERKYSKRAKELIEQYTIDVSLLPKDQIIREKDVLKLINKPYSIAEITSNKVLIYGGGGGCKIAIDILKQYGLYEIVGIIDRKFPAIKDVMGIPVISGNSVEELEDLYNKGYRKVFNSVIFNGKKHGRKEPYKMLKEIGFDFINIIHRSSIIEPSARVGECNIVAAGAIIGSEARIGNNCFINAGSIISHDCIISDSCHIASGAVLGGSVIIGENTLIGQGCTIFKDVKIGSNVVVMNGVSVFGNIPDNTVVENKGV